MCPAAGLAGCEGVLGHTLFHCLKHRVIAICVLSHIGEHGFRLSDSLGHSRFCENELVNLLCPSFADKADRENISFTVDTKLPGNLAISDTELCSVLSNGLENALRAAGHLSAEEKWVKLYCGMRANKLLEIKNPLSGYATQPE